MKIISQIFVIVIVLALMLLGYTLIGKSNTIQIKVLKDEWTFKPDKVTLLVGKTYQIKIYNEDDYEHSFYIDKLNINQVLPPQKEVVFILTPIEKGTYTFYCSIVCGEGHYRMNGQLIVN